LRACRDAPGGRRRRPRRVSILTFDDGYRLTRTIALPLMRQYGFGATIFLVTAYVGKTNLWDADEIQEPLLDASDIRDMQETGIEIGSQTATHAHLAALRPVEVLRELRTSREQPGAPIGSVATAETPTLSPSAVPGPAIAPCSPKYASSPCSLRSSPRSWARTSALMPTVAFTIVRITAVPRAASATVASTATSCT